MNRPYEGMKAILYARVSTDDKGQNPQQQIEDMRSWCRNQGVEVMAEYVDEGKTGANMNRPGMRELLGHAMLGGISLVIAQHPDRISRDTADMEGFRKRLQSFGVNIRYTTMDVAPETGTGQLLNSINTSLGEEWRRTHIIKVKKGMDYARRHGPAPGKKEIGRPKTDINIELIMELADEGLSLSKAAEVLKYPRATVIDRLKEAGRHEEFYNRLDRCRKGGVSETSLSINTKDQKTGGV